MNLILLTIFWILVICYLSGVFEHFSWQGASGQSASNLSFIEYLTQHKNRSKNYGASPENYQSFDRPIVCSKSGEHVHLQYEFPLTKGKHHILSMSLEPIQTSAYVDAYGIRTRAVSKDEVRQAATINTSIPEAELKVLMNQGCWRYRGPQDWGPDFIAIVNTYKPFCSSIATSIYESLTLKGLDTYFNRVQAALNFVQFIPYGVPDFDTAEWYYHELSVPPESLVLGYADCDSKSVFMASILANLIPAENMVLVSCMVKSANERVAGAHMMIAVSDLNIQGEMIEHGGKYYLLLETTAPWIIGKTDWEEITVDKIYSLV